MSEEVGAIIGTRILELLSLALETYYKLNAFEVTTGVATLAAFGTGSG
jgi:hypothetical protein